MAPSGCFFWWFFFGGTTDRQTNVAYQVHTRQATTQAFWQRMVPLRLAVLLLETQCLECSLNQWLATSRFMRRLETDPADLQDIQVVCFKELMRWGPNPCAGCRVGLRAYVLLGEVAVIRYCQWRRHARSEACLRRCLPIEGLERDQRTDGPLMIDPHSLICCSADERQGQSHIGIETFIAHKQS
ncbi:hypothetical protein LZ30DRAFT_389609 [Colletotrichum cereale]|nr:hypothetical protein LZ30DRAFT_389609 [Colletotrichum cereale]